MWTVNWEILMPANQSIYNWSYRTIYFSRSFSGHITQIRASVLQFHRRDAHETHADHPTSRGSAENEPCRRHEGQAIRFSLSQRHSWPWDGRSQRPECSPHGPKVSIDSYHYTLYCKRILHHGCLVKGFRIFPQKGVIPLKWVLIYLFKTLIDGDTVSSSLWNFTFFTSLELRENIEILRSLCKSGHRAVMNYLKLIQVYT